jgi:hypothetical protein
MINMVYLLAYINDVALKGCVRDFNFWLAVLEMNWKPSICWQHYNSLGRQPKNFGRHLKVTPGGFQGGSKTVPMQEQNFKDITLGMLLQVTYQSYVLPRP